MKELVGKTITEILVNEDQSILTFNTDKGHVSYETWGDCCSETWFADILGVKSLLGFKVISSEVMDLSLVPDDDRSRQEYDQFYGVKLITEKGYVEIIYRNSSNGYYGGNMGLMREPYILPDMTAITDDWSA